MSTKHNLWINGGPFVAVQAERPKPLPTPSAAQIVWRGLRWTWWRLALLRADDQVADTKAAIRGLERLARLHPRDECPCQYDQWATEEVELHLLLESQEARQREIERELRK